MWIVDRSRLLLLLLPSPEVQKSESDIYHIIIFRTWLTAGLGVFLDFASSFFSAASFLPPKLDLGVEVCDLDVAAGTGV